VSGAAPDEARPRGFARRLAELAAADPEAPAVRWVRASGEETVVTRGALDRWSNQLARWLARRGAGPGRWVVIGLPNEPRHLALAFAAWRVGAGVLPLSHRTAAAEAIRILDLVDTAVVVADWSVAHPALVSAAATDDALTESDAPLEDIAPPVPAKAVASGGSTGAPKVIVDPKPWAAKPGELVARYRPWVGFRAGQVQLLAGPLYHNAPFSWAHYGLFEEHTLVLLERFDADLALDVIERHRVQWACLVPTMMQRMLRAQAARTRDVGSLEAIFHTAAPCPPWVKRGWIDLLGPTRVHEAYGSTEGIGACIIRGDEWLLHPGSVGRPVDCELSIRDEAGLPLPAGQVGEVFSRPAGGETFRYLGAEPRRATDGFGSVGDLGWLDADGYLHLADRRTDLIVTGGVNVYPAEVEAVLGEHPAVRDAVVIGVPDAEWGKRVHAVIEPVEPGAAPDPVALSDWCRARLSPYKVPKSFELVTTLPRNEAGKIQRSALLRDRST
jgi:bile acid-coenzyme A ligase